MKLKESINVRKIGNEHILIADKDGHLDYTCVVSLNESAAYLLRETGKQDFSVELWADLLVAKYGIDSQQAHTDAAALLNSLTKAGVID